MQKKMRYNILWHMRSYGAFIIKLLCISTPTNAHAMVLMYETDTNGSNCGSIAFDKRLKTHTIVLDILQDDWSLNDCFNSMTDNDDIIIFSGDYILDLTTKNKLFYFLYNTPNIVIFINKLTNTIFVNPVATVLLQSHWSLVHIVVIDSETSTCENGYFGQEVNTSIYRFMNKLWQKYQIVDVVIEYPQACPNRFFVYDGTKKPNIKDGQLYERRVTIVDESDIRKTLTKSHKSLAEGYPLKANIFYRFPTSITECDFLSGFMLFDSDLTNGFCGVDALVMQDVMQTLKFNTTFEIMETTSNYGYVQSGHVTGTLGLIVRGEIDISFNSRFMVSYLENSFEFLFFIWRDSLCALMREPSDVPLWHYPFDIYNLEMWAFTLSSLSLVGLVMFAKRKITRRFGDIPLKCHVYVGNALWTGLFGFSFNKRMKRSLLAATCLLCSLVITAKYQGHVNYMFATLVRYDRLISLEELCDNDVQVYSSPNVADLLGGAYSNWYTNNPKTRLIQHLKFYPQNTSTTDYALTHPSTATIERSDVLLQTLINYRDENGRPLLYTVNECFQEYYLSYIVRSGFLFTRDLQILMMQIVEAGLPTVYYKWTRYTFKVVDPVSKPTSEPRPIIKISMREERVPFILLLVGYTLSIIAFVVEIYWDTRAKRVTNTSTSQKYMD